MIARRALLRSGGGGVELLVACDRDARVDEDRATLDRDAAARELDWALPHAIGWDDVGLRRDLLDLCSALGVHPWVGEQRSPGELREFVIKAAACGELQVVRREVLTAPAEPGPSTKPAVATAPLAAVATKQEAWIEITLADDGGAPYVGRVELEFPDGAKVTRSANEFGLVRLDGIATGSCEIRLLDVDASAVEAG